MKLNCVRRIELRKLWNYKYFQTKIFIFLLTSYIHSLMAQWQCATLKLWFYNSKDIHMSSVLFICHVGCGMSERFQVPLQFWLKVNFWSAGRHVMNVSFLPSTMPYICWHVKACRILAEITKGALSLCKWSLLGIIRRQSYCNSNHSSTIYRYLMSQGILNIKKVQKLLLKNPK